MNFEVGQLWTCKAPDNEKLHNLLVVSAEELDEQKIVGIAVVDSEMGDSPFMPFSQQAIEDSVLDLVQSNIDIADFVEGYEYWKELFIEGEAGVYNLSVDEVLNLDSE